MTAPSPAARFASASGKPGRPRLGFLGLGWIGRSRLAALSEADVADVVALADPVEECLAAAAEFAPGAGRHRDLDELLQLPLDGVVIATPSAMHAEQSERALERGRAVFCQKPLGRDARETARVVAAARAADRLLAADFSYRHLRGVVAALTRIESGELGRPFAGRFVFHNAYGPDKPWFRDVEQSGGGCVIDLGIHLVDLALRFFGGDVADVQATLLKAGRPAAAGDVEDYAVARLDYADGRIVEIACSWWLPAGRDAVIEATVHAERGGIQVRNVGGSFFDFETVELAGTTERELAREDGAWGAGAIADWTRALARGGGFDAGADQFVRVAEVVDRIYGR